MGVNPSSSFDSDEEIRQLEALKNDCAPSVAYAPLSPPEQPDSDHDSPLLSSPTNSKASHEDANDTRQLPARVRSHTSREVLEDVVKLIDDFRCGRLPVAYRQFSLPELTFDDIEKRLREDEALFCFWEDRIRVRWDGTIGRLIVMAPPTCLHEIFKADFEKAITHKLGLLAERHPILRPVIENIQPGGHAVISEGRKSLCGRPTDSSSTR
jgi:hypothetical protein